VAETPVPSGPTPAEWGGVANDHVAAEVAALEPEDAMLHRKEAGAVLALERARLPYELHNKTFFIDVERIQAIKAEGHYARLYDGEEVYFCPWSISKIEAHLTGHSFLRTHRSFLVNIHHARAFQRKKDKAYLMVPALPETLVPVSRFHLAEVRRVLGV
jgi:DNA-binding LytR/AlgR family response regulator